MAKRRRLSYQIEVRGRVIDEVIRIRGRHGTNGIRFTLLTENKALTLECFGYAARNHLWPGYDTIRTFISSRTTILEGRWFTVKRFWFLDGRSTYEDMIEREHGSLAAHQRLRAPQRFTIEELQERNAMLRQIADAFGGSDFEVTD